MPGRDVSEKAEQRRLREQMRGRGMSHAEVAAEMGRGFRLRPRQAWRAAWGWTADEAAERYNALRSRGAGNAVTSLTGSRLSEWERWPFTPRQPSLLSLCLLAEVYRCPRVLDLIDFRDREKLPPEELIALEKAGAAGAGAAGPADRPGDVERRRDGAASPAAPVIAYRWCQESALGDSWIGREVEMAAHDGSERAERAEQRDIGDATLEQLRSDVIRLSHDITTGEPFGLFQEMRRVRERMHAALDRRLWPRDATDLYLLLGCLNCLMSGAAANLGYPRASEELIRAAWAYAVVIDHQPLKAYLRAHASYVAYWQGRPVQARDLAGDGLRYLAGGPNGTQLHLKYARAAARLGDADAARRAIGQAREARDLPNQDDLLELGGEFLFSRATQQYLTGSALLEITGAERDAITELERATELYAAGPEEGEDHSFECRMLAHIELAVARLRVGELDAARPALGPVLALPPGQRIDPLPQRLELVRNELARPRYHGSPQAEGLAGEIEDFGHDTIVGVLASLPG